MKFVLASYGSRGDVEPCAAVGRELLRRGHEVKVAVAPDWVSFVESAGLTAVPYGLDLRAIMEAQHDFWRYSLRNFWRIQDRIRSWRELSEVVTRCWAEFRTTLKSLADEADLLVTGMGFEDVVADVAEYYDIPFATLHYLPLRANGQLLPFLPAPLTRSAMTALDWLSWRASKQLADAQRRELGLPNATGPVFRRIAERGLLEIQAYDEVCFPGLAAEWAKWDGQRPFVGALTMELPTDADDEVASWIAAGTPPIYFGFGGVPVESPVDTLAMIGASCAELGERALVCADWTDSGSLPRFQHVKVVAGVNHSAMFPACRAAVHHGGAGTTAAALRAGIPMLILWKWGDRPFWAAQVKRLKVGFGRRFASTTQKSLAADLRTILAPQYASRAREVATRMTKPTASVAAAADLVENLARYRRVG
ncbi:glycosyltransferase [Mycobacterium sp. SP-6446]|uniref:glycosyltransferase n=1 Tax=Mycobacterium sp. SP-6446 TaxID=1834162 RepID=UPI00096D3399|nr:glycosyltransferase [Mycobacterium sp. SP-6446]OMC19297.1 glycosyl transferase family 1 [Mycobacterium sp. SP-6446]